jgi:hypothetical protein
LYDAAGHHERISASPENDVSNKNHHSFGKEVKKLSKD